MTAFHHLYESSNHGVVHVKTLLKMEQSRTKTSTDLAKQIRWACKCFVVLTGFIAGNVAILCSRTAYESFIRINDIPNCGPFILLVWFLERN